MPPGSEVQTRLSGSEVQARLPGSVVLAWIVMWFKSMLVGANEKCLCVSKWVLSTFVAPAGQPLEAIVLFSTGIPILPVDPSLSNRGGLPPILPAAASGQPSSSTTQSVVVTEGIPPVSRQWIERIHRWEFIN